MRIALFGGTFDPPHCGHIGIAQAAVQLLSLERVLMAPVGRQPLKQDQTQSSFEDRLVMVQLACADHPPLAASLIDAPRMDGRFNYSHDTLERLHATLPPDDELFCLVGADSLHTLRHWHRAADALLLAQWIVAARPGFTLEALETMLPSGIAAGTPEKGAGWLRVPLTATNEAGATHQGTLWLLPDLHFEVSATELRVALADLTAGSLQRISQRILDPKVAAYARAHALYDHSHM